MALLIVLMNEGLQITLLLPFIGFFVAHLLNVTKERAGYTSGVLISVFMIGQFLSGKVLGRCSDLYGRRPVMLFSLLGSGICIIAFGMSTSFTMAMVTRVIHGLVNGNIGIAKAVVGEITDKSNEAKGFAVISLAWGCGCLIGPFFGGVLYDPAHSRPIAFLGIEEDSFFGSHPALLPCLAASCYSFIALAISLKTFPETNARAQPLSQFFVDAKERFCGISVPSTLEPNPEEAGSRRCSSPRPQTAKLGYTEIFKDPAMRTATMMYVVMSAVDFGWNEVFPLWAIASIRTGGMALSSAIVGEIALIGGVAVLISNLVFPAALGYAGDKVKFWQFSLLMWALFTVAIPLTPSCFSAPVALALVFLLQILRVGTASWTFGTVFLFIVAVAPREHLGAVNSIAQSSGCIARAIVPILITPFFALTIEHPHPQLMFNYMTSFALLAALLFVGYWFSTRLPPECNGRPDTGDAMTNPQPYEEADPKELIPVCDQASPCTSQPTSTDELLASPTSRR